MNSPRETLFSMIELLVVMTITAIVASLVLPALTAARNQARESQCRGNLKQQGLAIHLYSADYNDEMPLGNLNSRGLWADDLTWVILLDYSHDAGSWVCPEYPPQLIREHGLEASGAWGGGMVSTMYGLNMVTPGICDELVYRGHPNASTFGYLGYKPWAGWGDREDVNPFGLIEVDLATSHGPCGFGYGIYSSRNKISDSVTPSSSTMRVEAYAAYTDGAGQTDPASGGNQRHFRNRSFPAGGHVLAADGSVNWSSYFGHVGWDWRVGSPWQSMTQVVLRVPRKLEATCLGGPQEW